MKHKRHIPRRPGCPMFSRRQFMRGMGMAALGLLTTNCTTPPETPTPTATAAPTATALPRATTTAVPTATAQPVPDSSLTQVAIAQAKTYDRKLIREQVQALFDGIGGLDDVLQHGNRVALKTNLTGGLYFQPPAGMSAIESYLTHPEVVRAACELLRDAGAKDIFIVEAVFDDESYGAFGYEEIAKDVGATLIDLNVSTPYSGFNAMDVGVGAFIYENFTLNPVLEEIDAFVSVAKMKCHYECGVTHAMKNLVGLVPAHAYALEESHWWRSALHGTEDEIKQRLPRVILDLNRARPIHLALIDGVKTGEGGEVPRGTFNPVAPGVLLAGKNAVATDAVATAVMGFDPTIAAPNAPFLRGDNYLNIAHDLGLGTNRLDEIEVIGAQVADIVHPFKPSRSM